MKTRRGKEQEITYGDVIFSSIPPGRLRRVGGWLALMIVPPLVLREGLRCQLRRHPALQRNVWWGLQVGPKDGVVVRVVGIQPFKITVSKERTASAAMNDEGADDVTKRNLLT